MKYVLLALVISVPFTILCAYLTMWFLNWIIPLFGGTYTISLLQAFAINVVWTLLSRLFSSN